MDTNKKTHMQEDSHALAVVFQMSQHSIFFRFERFHYRI